jgi:glycosyltransferase involved in cell wall biosynthesis
MAAGTPVIAYAAGGLGEYITDADAGRAVPMSVEALRRACLEVLETPDLWRRMSANATNASITAHAPERYVDSVLGVYREAAESSGPKE